MKFFVDALYDSLLKQGEELCGDKVEILRNDDSFTMVLADGLGSGVKANILATLTSKIIATMMSQGAELADAIATIAATLPVCKERNVAYSTFTLVHVDALGQTLLAEFDNPLVLVYRNKVPLTLPRETLVVGGKTVYLSSYQANENDILVAFSDGVVHAGVGKLLDLGWMYDNVAAFISKEVQQKPSIRKMLRDILVSVQAFYLDEPGDDSTVCLLQYKKRVKTKLFIGPPKSSEQDRAMVEKFLCDGDYKVVCGGTTSMIVADYLNQEVVVNLPYDTPNLPPTATIPGIDLVTEGVLTMAKTVELLKELNQKDAKKLSSVDLNKKDGAHQLARLLGDESTEVHFLVGRAMNPAHQNEDIPISLNTKLQLVEECARQLQWMGKKVAVEFC